MTIKDVPTTDSSGHKPAGAAKGRVLTNALLPRPILWRRKMFDEPATSGRTDGADWSMMTGEALPHPSTTTSADGSSVTPTEAANNPVTTGTRLPPLTNPAPKKRGRPRKAAGEMMPRAALPSAATPDPAPAGADEGRTTADIHLPASPVGETHSQSWYDRLIMLNKQRKTLIAMRIALSNQRDAYIRGLCGFTTKIDDSADEATQKRQEKARESAKKRAQAIVKAFDAGMAQDDPVAMIAWPIIETTRRALEPFSNGKYSEAAILKEMEGMAKGHPVWKSFGARVSGFGARGFAVILAETGDLMNYANPAKVWKRLGLAPMDGRACSTWRRTGGLSADDWTKAGYSPVRRSQVFAFIQDPLLRAQNQRSKIGPYGRVYRHAKASALVNHVRPSRSLDAKDPQKWSRARSHAHASRLMAKALVLDLWRVFHGQEPRYMGTE